MNRRNFTQCCFFVSLSAASVTAAAAVCDFSNTVNCFGARVTSGATATDPQPIPVGVPIPSHHEAIVGVGNTKFQQATVTSYFAQSDAYGSISATVDTSIFHDGNVGTGFASASMANGTLRVAAEGQNNAGANPGGYINGFAEAKLFELLTFHVSAGVENPSVPISMAIKGSLSSSVLRGAATFVQLSIEDVTPDGAGVGASASRAYQLLNSTSITIDDLLLAQEQLIRPVSVPFGSAYDRTIRLFADVNTNGTAEMGPYLIDLTHTAALAIDLPAGVTYTSASGVFLTQAIPEPSSVWLFTAGSCLLWVLSRIRSMFSSLQ